MTKRKAILFGIFALLLFATTASTWYTATEQAAQLALLRQQVLFRLSVDRDALLKSQQTTPGPSRERLGGPLSAAEEDYANRAYPAKEIPFVLTQQAHVAFEHVRQHGAGPGKALGEWKLVGPSIAQYPAVLSFSGADYVASGRITSLAIGPHCVPGNCRVWVGAAGGGVWRTNNALANNPNWKFISGDLPSNAIGSLEVDPNDPSGNTIYAGTGEANASGDSEAGMGLFKSTDGGDHWSRLPAMTTIASPAYSGPAFDGRAIGSIAIHPSNPHIIYVATTRGVRGVSSVTGGATSNPPIAAPFGLYKSTDGGNTFTFIWNGNGSLRGVRVVALDPLNPERVYASAYQHGIWRSTGGGPFEQVFAPTAPTFNTDRTQFALTVKDGKVRIYAQDGAQGNPPSSFWRVDNADVPANTLTSGGVNLGWKNLTSDKPSNPYYATYNVCTGQCWYDQIVYTPKGYPDIVYIGGSYQYSEFGGISNGRALLLSTNAGELFTDMTWDATSHTKPNGLHPDHHALVTNPNNPLQFFNGSDGGLVRSSGQLTNGSDRCDLRGLDPTSLAACKRLLSQIPSVLTSLNSGLSTLQFQSVSVNPQNARHVQGGTQDNGTFETRNLTQLWPQIMYGDGGQSGFNVANPALRFNSFFGQFHDVNFRDGDPTKWVIASGPIASSPEGSNFYAPIIPDPHHARAGTIFEGSQSVWRTQDWGGNQAYLEANCPEFTTSGTNPACGDFVRIGPAGNTDLTVSAADYRGTTRAGGFVAAVERTVGDSSTLWVATNTGRVFISKNADAAPGSVTFTRLDSLAANSPGRFVSSIYIDRSNPNHAWIAYSGYNFNTPAQPGHVFEVTYNAVAATATWTNLDGGTGPLGDLPVTDLVRDDNTGDLYAATDFGVMRLANGSSTWTVAGSGLPKVEVAGLTIAPDARKLYAATHGRSVWVLNLP